jgi:hypothetical protein
MLSLGPPNTEFSGEAPSLAPASSAATHCWTAAATLVAEAQELLKPVPLIEEEDIHHVAEEKHR